MGQRTVHFDLVAVGAKSRAARDLVAGAVVVKEDGLEVAQTVALVVHGADRDLELAARVVSIDREGAKLELVGVGAELRAALAGFVIRATRMPTPPSGVPRTLTPPGAQSAPRTATPPGGQPVASRTSTPPGSPVAARTATPPQPVPTPGSRATPPGSQPLSRTSTPRIPTPPGAQPIPRTQTPPGAQPALARTPTPTPSVARTVSRAPSGVQPPLARLPDEAGVPRSPTSTRPSGSPLQRPVEEADPPRVSLPRAATRAMPSGSQPDLDAAFDALLDPDDSQTERRRAEDAMPAGSQPGIVPVDDEGDEPATLAIPRSPSGSQPPHSRTTTPVATGSQPDLKPAAPSLGRTTTPISAFVAPDAAPTELSIDESLETLDMELEEPTIRRRPADVRPALDVRSSDIDVRFSPPSAGGAASAPTADDFSDDFGDDGDNLATLDDTTGAWPPRRSAHVPSAATRARVLGRDPSEPRSATGSVAGDGLAQGDPEPPASDLSLELDPLANEGGSDEERKIARNLHERLRGLTTVEQIRKANSPDPSERIMLERLYGKNVWDALLRNQRLTAPEVSRIARMGTLPRPLLEVIVANAGWLQIPEIRRALLSNPRLGPDQIQRVLKLLSKPELKLAATQTAYPFAVRDAAKRLVRTNDK